MRFPRFVLATTCAFVLASTTASAGSRAVDAHVDAIARELRLESSQVAAITPKITAVHADLARLLDRVRAEGVTSIPAAGVSLEALELRSDQAIESELTPAQIADYREIKARQGAHHRTLLVEAVVNHALEDLTWVLELSSDQRGAMRPLLTSEVDRQLLLARKFEGKMSRGERAVVRQMRAVELETDRQIEALLEPHQVEAFRAYRASAQAARAAAWGEVAD